MPSQKIWLDDAFASGGSAGYDHKKMGITARGAWEAVKRHFREQGLDTQKDPFTVAAVGDMGGDVFGNGMLLSRKIKLVAAFNHLHIFLDPDPDMAATYRERNRLFKKVAGWGEYDESLISKGGGIYSRDAKTIRLSAEVRRMLDVEATTMQPDELISAILRMPVDLLWNGGIGTYVKASTESHSDVGDRGNDRVRVNADELRCKVVGEGGNLGLTQRGRIEAALEGTPSVVAYRTSGISWAVATAVLRTEHVSLPNLIAGDRVVPEYLQAAAKARTLADALLPLLDPESVQTRTQKAGLSSVKEMLGPPGAGRRVAELAVGLLGSAS